MTYVPGDPDHIGVHNELTDEIQTLADKVPIDVTLPPQVGLGDTGHVDHHNLYTAALQAIADSGGATDWADFAVPGNDGIIHTSEGIDGVFGATYKTWTLTSSAIITCTKPGLAELYIEGGGGGGGGTGGQYPTGGGGCGGIYINQGEVFQTTNDGGVYTIIVGTGASGNSQGGDSSIINGDGVETLITKNIGCGGGGQSWSTGSYVACSYQNARAGWGGGSNGGGGGKNGNPGSSCCAGQTMTKYILGGTHTIGNNNIGCGGSNGVKGEVILRVMLEMP